MLESLEDHVVGPPKGTIRSIGSTSHPAKTQRTKFTEEDDRILWNWVHESQQKGGSTNGNDIYYRLEATVSWFYLLLRRPNQYTNTDTESTTYLAVVEKQMGEKSQILFTNIFCRFQCSARTYVESTTDHYRVQHTPERSDEETEKKTGLFEGGSKGVVWSRRGPT